MFMRADVHTINLTCLATTSSCHIREKTSLGCIQIKILAPFRPAMSMIAGLNAFHPLPFLKVTIDTFRSLFGQMANTYQVEMFVFQSAHYYF